jgi:hypothetical protein
MKKYIILLLFTSLIYSQDGWKPQNTVNISTYNPSSPNNSDDVLLGNPNSPNNTNDPLATPINNSLLILILLGIGIGIYEIKNKPEKKEKQMEFTEIHNLKKNISKIETVRGGSEYTTVYLKNGDVLYFKEDFKTINNLKQKEFKRKPIMDLYCFLCEMEMPVKEKDKKLYCKNCGLKH